VIEFVFMLTRGDVTVGDPAGVLASLRESRLRHVGFKDVGPPPQTLAAVTAMAHEAGMEVMLEVVSTSAEDELRSLRAALVETTSSITSMPASCAAAVTVASA